MYLLGGTLLHEQLISGTQLTLCALCVLNHTPLLRRLILIAPAPLANTLLEVEGVGFRIQD